MWVEGIQKATYGKNYYYRKKRGHDVNVHAIKTHTLRDNKINPNFIPVNIMVHIITTIIVLSDVKSST